MRRLALIIAVLALYSPLALGSTYYVDGSGAAADNSFTGLQATWTSGSDGPWLTGGGATAQVSSSDTIKVRSATYPEIWTIVDANTAWSGVTAGDVPGWEDSLSRPIIDGGDSRNNAFSVNVAGVTVSGFACYSQTSHSISIGTSGSGFTLEDCVFLDGWRGVKFQAANFTARGNYFEAGASTVAGTGTCILGSTYTSDGFLITGNEFAGTGSSANGYQILICPTGAGGTISGNIFRDSTNRAIKFYTTSTTAPVTVKGNIFSVLGYGIIQNKSALTVDSNLFVGVTTGIINIASASGPSVRNNYFYGGTYGVDAANGAAYLLTVSNNIFNGTDYPVWNFNTTGQQSYNNCAWAASTDNLWWLATAGENITVDPLVANVTTGELWHLSPCFGGAGTDAAGLIAGADFTNQSFTGPIIGPRTSTAYFSAFTDPRTELGPTPKPTLTPAKTPVPPTPPPSPIPTRTPNQEVTLVVQKNQGDCGQMELEIFGDATYYYSSDTYYSHTMWSGESIRIAALDSPCGVPAGGAGWKYLATYVSPGGDYTLSADFSRVIWTSQTVLQTWRAWMTPTPAASPTPVDARYRDKTGAGTLFYLWCNKSGSYTCFTGEKTSATEFQYIIDADIISDPGGPYAWYRGQFGSEPRMDWVKRSAVYRDLMTFDYPTPTPTPSPVTPTPSITPTPSVTPTPTVTPTPSPTPGIAMRIKQRPPIWIFF